MELPTKIIPAETSSPTQLIIYGKPKIGKTTALSQLEGCLIVGLEKGSKFISGLKVDVNNLKELHELCLELEKPENKGKYKYGAIDTITRLEEWCEDLATKNYKKSPMGRNFDGKSVLELPNGAGYLWLRKAFEQWYERLSNLFEYTIFVAHLKDKNIEKNGKEVLSQDVDLTGKLKAITCSKADAIGYVYRKNNVTQISFVTSDEITCGSRCKHLIGQDIPLEWDKIYID